MFLQIIDDPFLDRQLRITLSQADRGQRMKTIRKLCATVLRFPLVIPTLLDADINAVFKFYAATLQVARTLAPSGRDGFYSLGQIEVFLRYAAGIVRRECEGHLVIADENIGMMIRFLRQIGYPVDQIHH